MHKYAYVHGNPVQGVDPSGLFTLVNVVVSIGIQTAYYAFPGPADFVVGALQALLTANAVNLEWDIEWAFNFELPDDWGSHSNNDWVSYALMNSIYDAYWIGIPFTDFGINPLDALFSRRRGPQRTVSAIGRVAKYSTKRLLETAQGTKHFVNLYVNSKIHRLPIVKFPKNAVKLEVKIKPTGVSANDISAANMAMGKPSRYRWVNEYGEPMTWHHDIKRGVMQLVSKKLHSGVNHVGGNHLWR